MLGRAFPVTAGSSRRCDSFIPVHCPHQLFQAEEARHIGVYETPHGTFRDLPSFMTQRPQSRFDLMKCSDFHEDVIFSCQWGYTETI